MDGLSNCFSMTYPDLPLTGSLLIPISEEHENVSAKVSIIGVGQVGMASAFSLVSRGLVSELALVDSAEAKLKGEMMDLQHGQAFLRTVKVRASTDYEITKDSKICVVTAGARQKQGESRIDLVQRNVEIFRDVIPNLVKYSPNAILLVVSNPVDVLVYVAWKLSGLPQSRVIGSGTMLDSSRFRFLVSERLNIAPQSCHGYIIGEHGDSSVAVWSSVNVAGTRLRDINAKLGKPEDQECWKQIHEDVVNSAYEIIKMKGYTNWAIGTMVSTLCRAIMKNQHIIYSLSTLAKGFHGITDEVFLSLPVVVGENGILSVFNQKLTESETERICESAKVLRKVIDGIHL